MKKVTDHLQNVLSGKMYFLILAVTFVICRAATWLYPFDSDHWIFYYVGQNWFHGGSLYVTAWDHKPPIIFAINGLMSLVLGDNIVVHRIFFTLVAALGIYLFYLLAKKVAPLLFPSVIARSETTRQSSEILKQVQDDKGEAGSQIKSGMTREMLFTRVSVLLYVFWSSLSQFTSSGNNNENFGLVFLLGMMLSYLSFREDRKWWRLLVAGSCFSILFFMKGNFLLLGVPIGVLMIVDYWRELQKLFLYSLLFVLPLFLQAGAWLAYFQHLGTLNDFFVASFLFSSKYASSAWTGDVSNNIILLLTLVVFLVPLLLLFYVSLRQSMKNLKNPTFWFVKMLVFAGLLLTLGVGSFYPYYFEIAMPVYVLVMTYGLFNLTDMNKYFRYFVYLVLAGSMVVSLGISMKQLANTFTGNAKAEAVEYQQIADYVDANTSSNDKVFDYDYGATFYELAHRDSGSRFISASVLLLDYRDHYGFKLDDKFISDMEKFQAKYVVAYRDQDNLYYGNKPVVDYFDAHYHLERTFTKFEVLRRN